MYEAVYNRITLMIIQWFIALTLGLANEAVKNRGRALLLCAQNITSLCCLVFHLL